MLFIFKWHLSSSIGFRRAPVVLLDCDTIVSEFKFQLHYYIHFWTKTFGKGMNLLIHPATG